MSHEQISFTKWQFVRIEAIREQAITFYAFIAWLLFRSKSFNYAEALVLIVYTLAFVLLLIIPVNMINFVPHHIETTFVEVPVMAGYFT